jgi:hypothetical protein
MADDPFAGDVRKLEGEKKPLASARWQLPCFSPLTGLP